MQFASGQLHGRVSKRCLAIVTQHAYCSENASLDTASVHALRRFRELLLSNTPTTLSMKCTTCWYAFTEASFEPEASPPSSAIRAVLVDQNGRKVKCFSEKLSASLLGAINVTNRKTIIFECEFFAVLSALVTWQDSLRQSNVVIHTGNDGVRDCFISCHTTSPNALPILDACLRCESNIQSNVWATRISTESNISDDPSRLLVQHLVDNGCVRNDVDCQKAWDSMVFRIQLRGSSERNLRNETNGARHKLQTDVMNVHESTEMFDSNI